MTARTWCVTVIAVCLFALVASPASAQAVAQLAAQNDSSIHPPVNYLLQPPVSQSSYVDPTYGTSIKRVSNALHTLDAANGGMLQFIQNEYSTANPFSSDNSRLILQHGSYFGLYDGSAAFLGNLPLEISAASEPG